MWVLIALIGTREGVSMYRAGRKTNGKPAPPVEPATERILADNRARWEATVESHLDRLVQAAEKDADVLQKILSVSRDTLDAFRDYRSR